MNDAQRSLQPSGVQPISFTPRLWGLLVLVLLAGLFAYYLLGQVPNLEAEDSLGNNVGIFLLININIVLVVVLAFLVVKNIVKLVLDRRRNILGSKLRTRLVVAFVGLSLVPTVLLFSVARGILERVLQGWFSPQVTAAVEGSLNITKLHYQAAETQLARQISHYAVRFVPTVTPLISSKLAQEMPQALADPQSKVAVEAMLEEKRLEYGWFELLLTTGDGRVLARAASPAEWRSWLSAPQINVGRIQSAVDGSTVIAPEQSLNGEFLRAYAALPVAIEPQMPLVLVGTVLLSPELSRASAAVLNALDDYNELRTFHRPLASSYVLTLVVVTLLIVFSAVWVGFYLARGLSIPIGLLAEGTEQVAHGNLEHRIPEIGDDELSVLVRSFNIMTQDLRETTEELVARRRYMETVLARVGVGVISVDMHDVITTCNETAAEILGLSSAKQTLNKAWQSIFPVSLQREVSEALAQVRSGELRTVSQQVLLPFEANAKHVQLTVNKLLGENAQPIGAVLLIDEITELVAAQRLIAWREVARRIAHEIKNPLTPILLSAQRLQRKYGNQMKDDPQVMQMWRQSDRLVIEETTQVIVRQVEMLRSLVNEFSRFARMPKVRLEQGDLIRLVQEVVRFQREAHPEVQFNIELDFALPEFLFDAEQLNRVMVNLLENAVASVLSQREIFQTKDDYNYCPTVEVRLVYERELEMVSLLVSDNGLGIPADVKPRLFEPYFSTKHSGTGLGLAIVSTIVTDHNGYVRVRDNAPRGAKFVVELPVNSQALSVRKRAQG